VTASDVDESSWNNGNDDTGEGGSVVGELSLLESWGDALCLCGEEDGVQRLLCCRAAISCRRASMVWLIFSISTCMESTLWGPEEKPTNVPRRPLTNKDSMDCTAPWLELPPMQGMSLAAMCVSWCTSDSPILICFFFSLGLYGHADADVLEWYMLEKRGQNPTEDDVAMPREPWGECAPVINKDAWSVVFADEKCKFLVETCVQDTVTLFVLNTNWIVWLMQLGCVGAAEWMMFCGIGKGMQM